MKADEYYIPDTADYRQMQQQDEQQMAEEVKKAIKNANREDLMKIVVGQLVGGASCEDMAQMMENYRKEGYI